MDRLCGGFRVGSTGIAETSTTLQTRIRHVAMPGDLILAPHEGRRPEVPPGVSTLSDALQERPRGPAHLEPAIERPLLSVTLPGEVAQSGGNVLALPEQQGHIQVVCTLEATPRQREVRHPPSPKPWNAQSLAECR